MASMDMETRLGALDCRAVQAQREEPPDLAVILCHGFGAPGDDLVGLAPELVARKPELASVRFVFPAAPIALSGAGDGGPRAWWWLDFEQRMALERAGEEGRRTLREGTPEGLTSARRQLQTCLAAVAEGTGLPFDRIVLGGFSQGAMVATDLALRAEEAPAALVVLSGALITATAWERLASKRAGLPVLQSHGRADPVLPFSGAEALARTLRAAGMAVDFRAFEGSHTIPGPVLDALATLLASLKTGGEKPARSPRPAVK